MKTSAADKYITDETIGLALAMMRADVQERIVVSDAVRALLPTPEQIVQAGNEALREYNARVGR